MAVGRKPAEKLARLLTSRHFSCPFNGKQLSKNLVQGSRMWAECGVSHDLLGPIEYASLWREWRQVAFSGRLWSDSISVARADTGSPPLAWKLDCGILLDNYSSSFQYLLWHHRGLSSPEPFSLSGMMTFTYLFICNILFTVRSKTLELFLAHNNNE